MSMLFNVGEGEHPPLPAGFPTCNNFEFTEKQYDYYKQKDYKKGKAAIGKAWHTE